MGSRTLDIVDQTLSRLPRETQSTTEISLPSHQDVVFPSDKIQDLVETLQDCRTPDPVQIKTVLSQFADAKLQHSLPFSEMKEDLRMAIYPSMKSRIRETIQPLLPPTNRLPIYSVAVAVHWELESYLQHEFDEKVDISDILTFTGEVTRAQALPCDEYMRQSWPRTGAATLAAIKYALLKGYSCEYPQPLPISDMPSRR